MPVLTNIEVEIKETLRSSDFDLRFREQIRRRPGGGKLNLCYQCGSCAGSCPSGKLTHSFNPRQIIMKTLLGLKNEVLSGDTIWLCAACYTCQERCPQGVEPADLMLAIRNVAVREGHAPAILINQTKSLIESGRIVKISRLAERRRAELGLPTLPSLSMEAIKTIVAATDFEKIVKKLEEM